MTGNLLLPVYVNLAATLPAGEEWRRCARHRANVVLQRLDIDTIRFPYVFSALIHH